MIENRQPLDVVAGYQFDDLQTVMIVVPGGVPCK